MSEPEYLDGRIMLAMPGMVDPNFERSVIAICVHDEQGAIGIGIGHVRAGISFHGLLEEVGVDPGVAPIAWSTTAGRSSRGAGSCCIRPTGRTRTRS